MFLFSLKWKNKNRRKKRDRKERGREWCSFYHVPTLVSSIKAVLLSLLDSVNIISPSGGSLCLSVWYTLLHSYSSHSLTWPWSGTCSCAVYSLLRRSPWYVVAKTTHVEDEEVRRQAAVALLVFVLSYWCLMALLLLVPIQVLRRLTVWKFKYECHKVMGDNINII